MSRKLFLLMFALLVALALPVGSYVLAQPESPDALTAEPDGPDTSDIEPNNTPEQAVPVVLGDYLVGEVTEDDYIDYYSFTGVAGDTIALLAADGVNNNWLIYINLYDSSLHKIRLQPYSNWATLPADGTYYVTISGELLEIMGSLDYGYQFVKLEGDEPNDTFETALPVEALAAVQGTWDYRCDVDMYRFEGRAGDVFPVSYPDDWAMPIEAYQLYDAAGSLLSRAQVLPADGTYYLKMLGWNTGYPESSCLEGDYTVTIGYPMWISTRQSGLGNSANKSSDILMRTNGAGQWRMVFDGSDVGITSNLDAIERLDDGSILMSLAAAQNVAGLGKVMPQDIIRFIPTSLGGNTAGTFEWYLDGSDVGLTTAGENIDAIVLQLNDGDPNALLISVFGNGSVPRQGGGTLNFKDEDLITFAGTAYGQASVGQWRMKLDGSTYAGMAAEDVSAATMIDIDPARNSRLLLAFNGPGFDIAGITGKPWDIVEIEPPHPDLDERIVIRNFTTVTKQIDALTIGVDVP